MINLETKYMGLELQSPIIVGSCGLTAKVEKIKEFEEQGAGAIVLKSIFEEEIQQEFEQILEQEPSDSGRDEYLDYLDLRIREERITKYLTLIKKAKQESKLPIIASINCYSLYEWKNFAREIQNAGADGLELNIYIPPSESLGNKNHTEDLYLKVVQKIKKELRIPVSLKLSPYFTQLSHFLTKLDKEKVDGLVLFSKFYQPDIDLQTLQIKPFDALTPQNNYTLPLRWIAINSGRVSCDLVASSGIDDGAKAIKMILAGAAAIQIVSPLYKDKGIVIPGMLEEIKQWMKKHNYNKIDDIKGILSQKEISNPILYERVQFMRYFSK
ncbi:MAG: dihydroorotate dehydrogenase-like protein [Bacteroidales bacterium]